MKTQEQSLSTELKELVAIGASVGAGCQPCVSHHLKAGANAGLDGEQLLATVVSAERVSAEAAVALSEHARDRLGPTVASPALLTRLEEALASLGAALGANDKPNIERQLRAAIDVGATRSQLQQALETAHTVQENAARIHRREAERLLDAISPTSAGDAAPAGHGGGCGVDGETEDVRNTAGARVQTSDDDHEDCGRGADKKTGEASGPADEREPTPGTNDHTGGCGWTAIAAAGSRKEEA